MTRNQLRDKRKVLEKLRETPNLLVVAKQTGVPRSTIYRWLADDPSFKYDCDKALDEGRSATCDLAEWQLLALVKDKEFGPIKYYLEHNHARYMPVQPKDDLQEDTPLSPQAQAVLNKALRAPGWEKEYYRYYPEARPK